MTQSFGELSKIYAALYELLGSSVTSLATREQVKKLLLELDTGLFDSPINPDTHSSEEKPAEKEESKDFAA